MNFKSVFITILMMGFTTLYLDAGERVVFAEEKLSIEVPDGWKKSKLNVDKTLAGWESPDSTTSMFFTKFNASLNLGMPELMDSVVTNFENSKELEFKKVDEYKTGKIKGVAKTFPAIFTTLDMTFKGPKKDFEMKYYLFVFDTGDTQYLAQATTTKPVWDVREKQIMSVIKTLIARK